MDELAERYHDHIVGSLSCFDRVMIWGSLPDIGHAEAAMNWAFHHNIRICGFADWAKQRHDDIDAHVKKLAADHDITVTFVTRRALERKEEYVAGVLSKRGDLPGLVCILSAMESCPCYRYYQHQKGVWRLRGDMGKCLHYYFYIVDEQLGLCCLRVPTWAPFRLQFYCNGHSALSMSLKREGIHHVMEDNALVEVADFQRAQLLADQLSPEILRERLEYYAHWAFPIGDLFPAGWHWTLRQLEYSTDLIFTSSNLLEPLYENLARHAIDVVKAPDVAHFLGKRLDPRYQGELTSDYRVRKDMTRIKHQLGPASLKMYNKRGRVLRIETTCNDMSFFKHYRQVVHRDGTHDNKLASVRKTIYSLLILRQLMGTSNQRYLDFLSALDDETKGEQYLETITRSTNHNKRKYRGFNFFAAYDARILEAVLAGEWNIAGLTTRWLAKFFPEKTSNWVGRQIKRLRVHHILRKLPRQLKYHLTAYGRRVVYAALATRRYVAIPALAASLGILGPEGRSRFALAVTG